MINSTRLWYELTKLGNITFKQRDKDGCVDVLLNHETVFRVVAFDDDTLLEIIIAVAKKLPR